MKVKIIVNSDNYAYLTADNDSLFYALEKSFTRIVSQYDNYWRRYRKVTKKHYTVQKQSDGSKKLKVKAGLITFLANSLAVKHIPYEIVDNRYTLDIKTNIETKLSDDVELRDYQEKAVRNVFFGKVGGFCSIQLPTGSGKTEVAASIIKTYLNNHFNRAVLYVVPTLKLMEEAQERFTKYGIKVNINGEPFESDAVNIITYLAICRSEYSKSEYDKVGAIVWDEAHRLKADKTSKVIHNFTKLNLDVALSATLSKEIERKKLLKDLNDDDLKVFGCSGMPVYFKTVDKSIKEKAIVPIKVHIMHNKSNYSRLSYDSSVTWHTIRKEVFQEDHDRMNFVADFVCKAFKENDYHTMCLYIPYIDVSKDYMLTVASKLSQYGLDDTEIILLFGSNRYFVIENGFNLIEIKTDVAKELIYKRIKSNKCRTIFSATTFFKEGIDVPNLQALVNVAGGVSEIAVKQVLGRTMRLDVDKPIAHIYEIKDDYITLERQLETRLNIYTNQYHADIVEGEV